MSLHQIEVSIPLDPDNFLRRECPLCAREFKIQTTEDERSTLVEREIENFLIESDGPVEIETDDVVDEEEETAICPYCCQQAPVDEWWTQEQVEYLHIFGHNIMADIINAHLEKMERQFKGGGGLIELEVKGEKMKKKEPWISPEEDDMKLVEITCCERDIKVLDEWNDTCCCPECGFEYEVG